MKWLLPVLEIQSWESEEGWGEQRASEVNMGGVRMGSEMGRCCWRSLYGRDTASWPRKNNDEEAPMRGTGPGTLSKLP